MSTDSTSLASTIPANYKDSLRKHNLMSVFKFSGNCSINCCNNYDFVIIVSWCYHLLCAIKVKEYILMWLKTHGFWFSNIFPTTSEWQSNHLCLFLPLLETRSFSMAQDKLELSVQARLTSDLQSFHRNWILELKTCTTTPGSCFFNSYTLWQ